MERSGQGKPRPYKRMEGGNRVRMKRGRGDKIVRRDGGRGAGKRIDELRDLRFVGVSDDPRDSWKRGQFLGGALGVATGDEDADIRIGGMKLANGVAGLGVGGGCDSTGIDDNDVSSGGRGGGSEAAIDQLPLDGGAIGLRGAATELFDEETWHLRANVAAGDSQHRVHRGHKEWNLFCADVNKTTRHDGSVPYAPYQG